MSARHLLPLLFLPGPALAEDFFGFDCRQFTWTSSHIVLVEGGTVVESWKGDLKAGQELPKRWPQLQPPPLRSEKKDGADRWNRKVLFLEKDADNASRFKLPSAASIAWLDDDQVYIAAQFENPGALELTTWGRLPSLRQSVDLGLALQTQFNAAKAEPDLAKRAQRLSALTTVLEAYSGMAAMDAVEETSKCGRHGISVLARLATNREGRHQLDAFRALAGLGDDAFEAVLALIDSECRHWKAVVAEMKTVQLHRHSARYNEAPWRGSFYLQNMLETVRHLKVSPANRELIVKHEGLRDLEKIFAREPRPKDDKFAVDLVHKQLKDILGGKFADER